MAQLATVKHWNPGFDKWTLNTGYYDEWGFHPGNSARYGEVGKKVNGKKRGERNSSQKCY